MLSLVYTTTANAASVLYGAEIGSDPQLLTLNIGTGASTPAGSLGTGLGGFRSLAYDSSTDILFGISTQDDSLYTVNRTSGLATLVGAVGFNIVYGIEYDSSTDTLYGADASSDQLITINRTTGASSAIGSFGLSGRSDLAYDSATDTLFAVNASNNLYTINRTTGAANLVGALGSSFMYGLAYDAMTNILYGTDAFENFWTINKTTGAAAFVGGTGSTASLEGMAFVTAVPIPATAWLFGSGLIGLVGMARRKKA